MRDERYDGWKEVYRESKRRTPWAGVAHEPDVDLDDPDFIRSTFGDEEIRPEDALRRSVLEVKKQIKPGAASRGWTFLKAVQQARRRERLRFMSTPKELVGQRVDPDLLIELQSIQTWEEFTRWRERVLCSYPTRREAAEDQRAQEEVSIAGLPYGGLVTTVKQFTVPSKGWSVKKYTAWRAADRPAVPSHFTMAHRDDSAVAWPGRRPITPPWSSEDVAGMFRWMLADTATYGTWEWKRLWAPVRKRWVWVRRWVPVSRTVHPIVHAPDRYGKSSTYNGWKQYAIWIKRVEQRERAEALRRLLYHLQQLLGAYRGVRERRQTSASVLLYEDTCPDHGDHEPCGKCLKMHRSEGEHEPGWWRRVSREYAQQSQVTYQANGQRVPADRVWRDEKGTEHMPGAGQWGRRLPSYYPSMRGRFPPSWASGKCRSSGDPVPDFVDEDERERAAIGRWQLMDYTQARDWRSSSIAFDVFERERPEQSLPDFRTPPVRAPKALSPLTEQRARELTRAPDREITSEQQRLLDAFEGRPDMAKGEKLATVSVKKMPADLWHEAKMAALAARQEMGEWLAEAIREKLERRKR